ncbi:hypothetical protein GCM10009552_43170 [Rothia nasimurium]
MGLRDSWGTVVCDGQGGFKIINKDPTSTASCTQRHEESHIEDFKRWAPNICKGAEEGYAPGPELDRRSRDPYYNVPSYPLQRSECKAYRVSLD